MASDPLLFAGAGRSFEAFCGSCCDIDVTHDGHVLLAVRESGIVEYCIDGHELSRWHPPERTEEANTVAALGDGRAAVGLWNTKLIVLLRRAAAGDAWIEDSRLAVLQFDPWCVAAHGDLLAVVECSSSELAWEPGQRLAMVHLSGAQPLSWQSREYAVLSVAITARLVVTASHDKVAPDGGGGWTRVVDAYTHSGHQRLWRYAAETAELVCDVCAAPDGNFVYVALRRDDQQSGSWIDALDVAIRSGRNRVAAIDAEGGWVRRGDVVSSERHGLMWPCRVSMGAVVAGQRPALFVLIADNRTVTVFKD